EVDQIFAPGTALQLIEFIFQLSGRTIISDLVVKFGGACQSRGTFIASYSGAGSGRRPLPDL
ncbi:hypothetical protein KXX03_008365, partial [Aspergillus fumigatus]